MKTSQPFSFLLGAVLLLVGSVAVLGSPTNYVDGEVLVTFKKSTGASKARVAAAALGLKVLKSFDRLSEHRRQTFLHLRSGSATTAALIAELRKDPAVESVEPNYLRRLCDMRAPNDEYFSELWGLQNTGQQAAGTYGTPGADIRFLTAWGMA